MKKLLICIFFLSFFGSKAQKVDLDHFYFPVSYQILPKEPVPYEKRTYSSKVKLGGALQTYAIPSDLNDKLTIIGWKKVDENPTVDIEVNLEDFVEKGVTPATRIDEKKDKDGKVISRKEYYYVTAKYATRGYANVKGPRTPVALSEKQLEEEKAKQAAVSTNRFLKNVVVKKDTTSNDGYSFSFNKELVYNSKEFETSSDAMKDFYLNKSSVKDMTLRNYVNNSLSDFWININSIYGFKTKKDNQILWILDSKDEEGKTQSEAIMAVKNLFETMKANEPIDDLKSNIQPLIEYFDSLKTKYPDDNKPSRKMRYSAYYNLAVIYLMLDEPEKSIAESEKLIANDYDKADGKALIVRANDLINSFRIAKTKSTHNPALN